MIPADYSTQLTFLLRASSGRSASAAPRRGTEVGGVWACTLLVVLLNTPLCPLNSLPCVLNALVESWYGKSLSEPFSNAFNFRKCPLYIEKSTPKTSLVEPE